MSAVCSLLQQTLRVCQGECNVFAPVQHFVELGINHLVGKGILLVYGNCSNVSRCFTPDDTRFLSPQKFNRQLKEGIIISFNQRRESILSLEGAKLHFTVKRHHFYEFPSQSLVCRRHTFGDCEKGA